MFLFHTGQLLCRYTEYVAFTSKSTNMGTYVYNALCRIPEEHRGLLIGELSDKGLVNCWFVAGLLYKIKLTERWGCTR
jgi:hypothetical protein